MRLDRAWPGPAHGPQKDRLSKRATSSTKISCLLTKVISSSDPPCVCDRGVRSGSSARHIAGAKKRSDLFRVSLEFHIFEQRCGSRSRNVDTDVFDDATGLAGKHQHAIRK